MSESTCPTCGGPVDEYKEDGRTFVISSFVETEHDMMALGRLQNTADTLGYNVEKLPITPTQSRYIVLDAQGKQLGTGVTRVEALRRAFGATQLRKPKQV